MAPLWQRKNQNNQIAILLRSIKKLATTITWQINLKQEWVYKAGKLKPERLAKLEQIGFDFEPKRQRLQAAQSQLAEKQAMLQEAKDKLAEVSFSS